MSSYKKKQKKSKQRKKEEYSKYSKHNNIGIGEGKRQGFGGIQNTAVIAKWKEMFGFWRLFIIYRMLPRSFTWRVFATRIGSGMCQCD